MSRFVHTSVPLTALLALALAVGGCGEAGSGSSNSSGSRRGKFEVVAAENFWGSIAGQLAGDRAVVHSIIVNPGTDPHSYEPTARDARTFAGAKLAIVNGIGYDGWASQLIQADPLAGRVVLNVGDLLGLHTGDNPHQWYSPENVHKVIAQIVADYDRLDPGDTNYFAQRQQLLLTRNFARYDHLLAEIRARYAGVPVGYSESIFRPLGEALGLKLLTPYSFTKAIAEGSDVSVQDKETVDSQAQNRRIAVWVFNSQNLTPDVQRVNQLVRAARIPMATITETLAPASATFEQWQVSELEGLLAAVHKATGR